MMLPLLSLLSLIITFYPSPLLPAAFYTPLLNHIDDEFAHSDLKILTNPSSSTLSTLDSNSEVITLSHSAGSQRMIMRRFKPSSPSSRLDLQHLGHIFVSYNNYPLSSSMPGGAKIARFRDYVSLINLPSRSKSVSRRLKKISSENVLIVQAANDGIDQSYQLHEALKDDNDVRWCRLGGGHLDCVNSEDCKEVVVGFVRHLAKREGRKGRDKGREEKEVDDIIEMNK
ncbi:hypothetical protein TrVE_jg11716 [Triparma verrucosa]|uniref:Uncharacterized protein n=2 Tax=Triparma TaxID=722752 RepID=A0A9W6ZKY4_9STRA|nr:hypothetical protein TrST_g9035 [Triparma strigata]GMH89124.1 hypothetical protein TrVE_jg11716 [Triparma verrucosa]